MRRPSRRISGRPCFPVNRPVDSAVAFPVTASLHPSGASSLFITYVGPGSWTPAVSWVGSDQLVADFSIRWELLEAHASQIVGVDDKLVPSPTVVYNTQEHNVQLAGSYILRNNGVVTNTGISTAVGDVFGFDRSGSDVHFVVNTTIRHTWNGATVADLYPQYTSSDQTSVERLRLLPIAGSTPGTHFIGAGITSRLG